MTLFSAMMLTERTIDVGNFLCICHGFIVSLSLRKKKNTLLCYFPIMPLTGKQKAKFCIFEFANKEVV